MALTLVMTPTSCQLLAEFRFSLCLMRFISLTQTLRRIASSPSSSSYNIQPMGHLQEIALARRTRASYTVQSLHCPFLTALIDSTRTRRRPIFDDARTLTAVMEAMWEEKVMHHKVHVVHWIRKAILTLFSQRGLASVLWPFWTAWMKWRRNPWHGGYPNDNYRTVD